MLEFLFEPIFTCAALFGIPSKMFAKAVEKQESNLLVLLYHDASENQFRNHLHFLDKHFDFINLNQLTHVLRNREFPADLTATITFDDGLQTFYNEVFPVIKETEIPVANFVTSGVIDNEFRKRIGQNRIFISEKAKNEDDTMTTPQDKEKRKRIGAFVRLGLTSKQLKELDKHPSITIGSHSNTHPVLTEISYDECKSEFFDSKRILESLLGHAVRHFAYPYGIFTEREMLLAEEAGYISAAGVEDAWITRDSGIFSFERKGAGPMGASLHRLKCRIGK